MELLPGDVFLTASSTWLGRAIRFFQSGPGEGPARVNHVGLIVSGDPGAWSTEALWRVRSGDFRFFYGGDCKDRVAVYRHKGLNGAKRHVLSLVASRYSSRSYGVGKLVLHAVDHFLARLLGRPVYAARRLAFMDRVPICSYLVAMCYADVGIRFLGLPPAAVQPDDIHDHVAGSDEWEQIHPLARLEDR